MVYISLDLQISNKIVKKIKKKKEKEKEAAPIYS